jgi:hypothetical protein
LVEDLQIALHALHALRVHLVVVGLFHRLVAVAAVVVADSLVFLLFLPVEDLEKEDNDREMRNVVVAAAVAAAAAAVAAAAAAVAAAAAAVAGVAVAVAVDAFVVAGRVPFFAVLVAAFCHHLDHRHQIYPFYFAVVAVFVAAAAVVAVIAAELLCHHARLVDLSPLAQPFLCRLQKAH